MSTNVFFFRSVVILAFVAVLSGCSSLSSMPGKKVAPTEGIQIYNGMPVAELVELLGEPMKVEGIEAPREGFEVWVYKLVAKDIRYEATGTEEIPFYDPVTGEYRPLTESIINPRTSTLTVETQFLIADGVVVGWKRNMDVDKSYN